MRHVADLTALGRRIRTLREARGLSQRDLAFEGASYAYISRVENGGRQPSEQVLGELARRLGTSVRYLKTGDADPVELALADARLNLLDLTDEERQLLEHDLDEAVFKTAREVAWAIRQNRARAALAAASLELTEATA